MNDDEIVDLLTAVAAYDRRTGGKGDVIAWRAAAHAAGWTFEEALAAVAEHFAHSTAWLMPAHVTAIIKAHRRDRAERYAHRGLPAAPPASPETRQRIMAELTARLSRSDSSVPLSDRYADTEHRLAPGQTAAWATIRHGAPDCAECAALRAQGGSQPVVRARRRRHTEGTVLALCAAHAAAWRARDAEDTASVGASS